MPSPALGDLTGNGIPEVVASSADGWVRAYNSNGSVRWATHLWAFSPQQAGGPVAGGVGPPGHWIERGRPSRRTSLVIDPPDGRFEIQVITPTTTATSCVPARVP